MSSLVESMAEVRDPRAAALLWELLADPKGSEKQAAAIESGLLSVYGINRWYSYGSGSQSDGHEEARLELARSAKPRATSGSDPQRLVALGLLTYADTDEATRIAKELQADAAVGEGLRIDAFQVMLVCGGAEGSCRRCRRRDPARTARGRNWPCGILFMAPRCLAPSARHDQHLCPVGGTQRPLGCANRAQTAGRSANQPDLAVAGRFRSGRGRGGRILAGPDG